MLFIASDRSWMLPTTSALNVLQAECAIFEVRTRTSMSKSMKRKTETLESQHGRVLGNEPEHSLMCDVEHRMPGRKLAKDNADGLSKPGSAVVSDQHTVIERSSEAGQF